MSRKKSQMRSRLENFGYALRLTRRFYPQKLICTIVLTVLKGVISFFSLQYMRAMSSTVQQTGCPSAR